MNRSIGIASAILAGVIAAAIKGAWGLVLILAILTIAGAIGSLRRARTAARTAVPVPRPSPDEVVDA